jgi:hypothetical protein
LNPHQLFEVKSWCGPDFLGVFFFNRLRPTPTYPAFLVFFVKTFLVENKNRERYKMMTVCRSGDLEKRAKKPDKLVWALPC